MKARIKSYLRGVTNFHEDEEGMEAIQVVAIVAIAAIVLIFAKKVLWPKIQNWAQSKTDELTSE